MRNIFEEDLSKERAVNLLSSKNNITGHVFRTFLIRFPKILLQELNTHRVLVRNCGSSRAIPTSTFISNIRKDPYIPKFTKLSKGMIGDIVENNEIIEEARNIWLESLEHAIKTAEKLNSLDIHKQDTNRVLEPYTHVDLVLSGTDWDNFIKLRTAFDTQLGFKAIADKIAWHIKNDIPQDLNPGEWHIPFKDIYYNDLSLQENLEVCIARIARVSYMRHGSNEIELEKDIELARKLLESGHLSPLEHVAKCVDSKLVGSDVFTALLDPKLHNYLYWDKEYKFFRWTRNYAGFYTYRHHIEDNKIIN